MQTPRLPALVLLASLAAASLWLDAAPAKAVTPADSQSEPASLRRAWQGIPGLERTAGGRTFVSWFSGGRQEPALENTVLLCQSDDNGRTFSTPKPMAGPRAGARAYDPTLWLDPAGRLWFIFNRSNRETAEHGVYARLCEHPDAPVPAWGPETRLGFEAALSFRMNKPTVLSTGEWVLPVTHAKEPVHGWFAGPKQLQGVGISKDQGRSWTLHGALKAPDWALENMLVELRDGRLWMLIRTGAGVLWESFSTDRGLSWSEAAPSTLPNPGSRFFIRRLSSGNLLLVNHYHFKGRSHMTARLSPDDGASWNEGLLLDERSGVSYPDGVQDKDGLLWLVHDRDRQGAGEILLSNFREEDVAAGKDVSGTVKLKQVVGSLNPTTHPQSGSSLLPPDWDAKKQADAVLSRLVRVTGPGVKGAHDAEMAFLKNRAYIVAEVNDLQASESADWPFIYSALSVVNLDTLGVERVVPIARSEQVFANQTLPVGACFVPRILKKDDKTLRCFFASEQPGKRQAQTWFLDFDAEKMVFENALHKAKLKTAAGTFDMEPQALHADAARLGFQRAPKDFGLYIFDSFKVFDRKIYAALNNYPGGQNALSVLNPAMDTFEVLGHYNEPGALTLTESAVNRLPDGTWMAICRQEGGNRNYTFSTSKDGIHWTAGEHREFVPNGTSSKPTFDKFGSVYYLGWQEKTTVNKANRSVFNVDVSVDGVTWERKYRFETEQSFQYPTFRQHNGDVWLCVTQGDSDPSRKERIMFGRLE